MQDNTVTKLVKADKKRADKRNVLAQPFLKWAGGSAIR